MIWYYIHTYLHYSPEKDDFPMVMTMSRRQLTGSGRRIRFQTSSGRLNVQSPAGALADMGKSPRNAGKIMGKSSTIWLFNIAMENHHF